MNRRQALLAAAALLAGRGVAAETTDERPTTTTAAPRRRSRRDRSIPLPPPPPPPLTTRGDPAPVPDRDIEAPRRANAGESNPRLDPALIDPREPRYGATTDPNSPQAREDRLLRQPAAGARLRLPFGY